MKGELEELIFKGENYIKGQSEDDFSAKISAHKWSKKEILGHLVDSGINNLQRFTEIQYQEKPFQIKPYHQDALVKANGYQNSDTSNLLNLWVFLNLRILHIIELQNESSLAYEIRFEDGQTADLKFLISDYVKHTEHHLNQIMRK